MSSIFHPKLTPSLARHLSGVDLLSLSRLPASRLATSAIPHIDSIELVSSTDFTNVYDNLYIQEFPKRAERERSDLIVTRLAQQASNEREGFAPYRIVGIRDAKGEAIAASQFSVLPLQGEGEEFAVPYLQYIYVRKESRRQDMSEVLHMMTLGVAVADARDVMGGRSVPFTLFEMEPPGHGDDEESRAFSVTRAKVHAKSGAVAIMLVRERGGEGDESGWEEMVSPHVQPGLEVGEPPLTLLWAVRQSPSPGREWRIEDLGVQLTRAYYQSLRDEGFPQENIRLAEEIVEKRCQGRRWKLVPLDEIPVHGT